MRANLLSNYRGKVNVIFRLRMVVMGHRRINMMQALPDEPEADELPIEEVNGGGSGEQQVPSITHDQSTAESSDQDSTVSSTGNVHLIVVSIMIHE